MLDYTDWVGRRQTVVENISPEIVRRMAATMNLDKSFKERDALPPCWHWLFFNQIDPQSILGEDGHPPRGDFLPPVSLPRRMFAGSRLDWRGDLKVGARIEKESTILSVESKSGSSGDMVFVTVRHLYREDSQQLLEEQQDIVYRDVSSAGEREALAALAERVRQRTDEDFSFAKPAERTQRVLPDPVRLFRYSAATFNGHRIHYDHPYATGVEHYPGLVVHGPLLATMLVGFLLRDVTPGHELRHFEFRAKRPTFDIGPFHLHAGEVDENGRIELWSTNNVGEVAVDGWAACR